MTDKTVEVFRKEAKRLRRNAYMRAWNKANRTSIAVTRAKWQEKDPEGTMATKSRWQKKYYEGNKKKIKISHRERYLADPAKVRAINMDWVIRNPDKCRQYGINYRALKRGSFEKHTAGDIQEIIMAQKGKCAYCNRSVRRKRHVDHIIPVSKGGGNGRRNIQILCPPCNQRKSAKNPVDFAQEMGFLI